MFRIVSSNLHQSSRGEGVLRHLEWEVCVRVEVSAVIDRPVADVFHFYAFDHVHNHPRWDPDMELEQVSDGPIGVGTVIRKRNSHSGTPVEGR